ncbi:hypothetical protein IWQ60_005032 [Tieghemiomyces parasiticus]|uniref:Arrestin C-terminal-like domain-containing protein n=1 Tax=Tieghemiomyces parasiticus TaxID=78921 RepID=A0A9W8ACI6_9FUNG|nr:hypothetical protein IWQ60_005032 [Tieghemiomyces parasiticus]
MKPAPAVEIVVFDNPLVIRGNADEAAGSLLRGQLVLRLHDTIKIKSINLRLKGREHVFWSEGFGNHQSLFREKRDLIDHEWSFLDSATTPVASPSASPSLSSATKQKKNHAHPFGPGEYVYDFDLVIPGDLPETTHTEHGHVTYKLKAVVERTTFHMNMVHETVLPVKRQPLPSSTEWLQSLVIEDSWEPYITYQINAPSKIYSDGTTIPLSLNFTPQTKGVRVLAASALLKEYVRYTTSDRFSVRRLNQVITRVDKHFQPPSATREGANTDDVYDETGALRAEIALKVPQAYREVQYDASTNFMEISHKLKVLIKLRDHNRKVHHIYIAAPVCIMHGDFEEAATLPPYIRADPDHTLLVGTSVGDVDSPAASAVPYVASRFTGASAGLLQTVPSAGDFSDLMHHRFVATSHPGSPAISRRASLSTPEQSSLDQQLSVTESSATVSPPVFGLTPPPPPYSLVVTSGSR